MAEVTDLVHRFLGSIGRPREAEYYLSLFRSQRTGTFATLAVSDSVVREGAGALVADLTFLSQLGLRPVVALGVGSLGSSRAMAESLASRLAHLLARVCLPAEAPDVTRTNTAIVDLSPAGPSVATRFDALARLITELGSRKVVFVGRRSGIQMRDGTVPSLISLEDDFHRIQLAGVVDSQSALLGEIKRLLDGTTQPLTASVTSPLDLLRELFTVKGAGTLVRRGSRIDRHGDWTTIDRNRLRDLIQKAFDKTPVPDLFDRPMAAVFLERDYRGAAIVGPAPFGAYLSKFAVDVAAQGEGLGSDLWRALTRDFPRLVWRSRPANPITAWYQQVCDGMIRGSTWQVFWRGLEADEIPAAIAFALGAPVDFGDGSQGGPDGAFGSPLGGL